MPEPLRTAKTLAEWEELDYFRRPRPLRRLKVWITLLTFIGAIVLCGAFFAPGGKRLLQAGPLSTAHARFADRCELCHTESMRTVKRIFHVHDSSVTDQACTHCHSGPVHNERQDHEPACASCHREHRGHEALARMDDTHCIDCHADLKVKDGQAAPANPHIRGFGADHPYGSLFAKGQDWKDPGTIKFTHQNHLQVHIKNAYPGMTADLAKAYSALKEQQCQACHKPEADGLRMQPVRYEQNCKVCHPLPAPAPDVGSDPKLQTAAGEFRNYGLPHPAPGQSSTVATAMLRANYLRFFAEHPNALKPSTSEDERPRPGEKVDAKTAQSPAAWIDAQMVRAIAMLKSNERTGCLKCHHEAPSPDGPTATFIEVQPARIPKNWLPKSIFNHAKHITIECAACHEKALTSNESKDVMIPKVDSCVQCHNKHESIRSDCLACHGYHPAAAKHTFDRRMSTEDFLKLNK